jgi:ABC-type multidrug transport system permease subunit
MNPMLRGYWSIAFKEFLHLWRDPVTLVIALAIPALQLTLFGFAIDFDVRHIPAVVVDMDRSRESRAYLDHLHATQYVDVVGYRSSAEAAVESLRVGEARIAVIIPPDFARRSTSRDVPQVRVLIDGSDSQVALRARMAFLQPGLPAPGSVDARINMLFNPTMRTTTFMVPGLIGVIMQLVTVSLTAFSLVREREQGTLEQLMVSPVGRLGLMLGKLTPYAVLAIVEMAAVLFLGWMVFDVQVAGSLATLFLMATPFVIAALALGLLISTVAQNQAQALQFTTLITLPTIVVSGFVFPRETMPGAIYLLSLGFPATFFLQILRGVVVRGAGFRDLLPSLFGLVTITIVLLSIAVFRFRKSIA